MDGSLVPSGWTGRDKDLNWCNRCSCNEGSLLCTKHSCAHRQLEELSNEESEELRKELADVQRRREKLREILQLRTGQKVNDDVAPEYQYARQLKHQELMDNAELHEMRHPRRT